jgi:hypothetical protein
MLRHLTVRIWEVQTGQIRIRKVTVRIWEAQKIQTGQIWIRNVTVRIWEAKKIPYRPVRSRSGKSILSLHYCLKQPEHQVLNSYQEKAQLELG